MKKMGLVGGGCLWAAFAFGQSGLTLELTDLPRTPGSIDRAIDELGRNFGRNAARLTAPARKRWPFSRNQPFSLPQTVHITQNGRRWETPRGPQADITLEFDTAGSRAFPTAYRDLLQSIFDTAKPTLNLVFGDPAVGGVVRVRNYDADIGDRDAVAGGLYVSGPSREIRFPVYVSPEATAVNFLHTLLLAYLGDRTFAFDGYQEGLVRAATMRVVRTPGALPASLDPANAEAVLDATYDVGSFYDWYNQRALGGPTFIAPNLKTVPLPPGGSLGGIYLLRYQMAGSAWQKLLAENPDFIRQFMTRYYASPGAGSNPATLVTLGQQALDAATGVTNATVEGQNFAAWTRRQWILDPTTTRGAKLLVQPIPIADGLGGTDFGVFDVSATYFETLAGGNETLLSATCYPIFWEPTYNRVFPSAQDDVIPIAGAYGSVTPNFPDLFAGQPYRVTLDIPVSDRIARTYVPAGAIATATRPVANDFYGTVLGVSLTSNQTARVRAFIGATLVGEATVRNGAFGARFNTANYLGYTRLRVEVVRRTGTVDAVLATRFVNKGPGALALELRVGGETTYSAPFTGGIQAYGLPLEPFASTAGELFGVNEADALAARYDARVAAYDLYPDTGAFTQGQGFFARIPVTGARPVEGRVHPGQPVAVALQPGWNLVANPLAEEVPFSRLEVIRTNEAPVPWNEASGNTIGSQIFRFVPGASDVASGFPETGSYLATTSFGASAAVYVRVLAPEGVTLLFRPGGSTNRPGKAFIPDGWSLRARLYEGTRLRSEAQVAQSTTATNAFDRAEDSGLPPAFVRGVSISSQGLSLDSRRLGTAQTYALTLNGLTPGRSYRVDFSNARGQTPGFLLTVGNRTTLVGPGSDHRFVASSPTQRLELRFVRN